jgi:hypothetical protein
MEQQQHQYPHNSSLGKRSTSLLPLIFDTQKVDKVKVKEHFLENCSTIPQEFRLYLYKIFLGKVIRYFKRGFDCVKLFVFSFNTLFCSSPNTNTDDAPWKHFMAHFSHVLQCTA